MSNMIDWDAVNVAAVWAKKRAEDCMKEETLKPTEPQPPPQAGQREITALVIADLVQRRQDGIAKYGRPLESFNGRDPLKDAYQEALDLCQYLRQLIEERDSAK